MRPVTTKILQDDGGVTRTAAMPGRSEPGLANDISDPTGLKPLHWTTRERVWCRLRAAANRFRGRRTVVGRSWSRDCFLQCPGDCARGLVSDDGRYRATPFSADRFLDAPEVSLTESARTGTQVRASRIGGRPTKIRMEELTRVRSALSDLNQLTAPWNKTAIAVCWLTRVTRAE